MIIAIDGPAGSGKSTVAKALAQALGLEYLDTGAMYRSVTFAALRHGLDPTEAEQVARLARQVDIRLDGSTVCVDGVDATIEIRGTEVTRAVSAVASNSEVRIELVGRQREWAATRGGGVVEGRDTGSVVFPDALLKVYLTATEEERAARRAREVGGIALDQVASDLARRDRADTSRATSPLHAAEDAIVVDTTGMAVAAVVELVLALVRERAAETP